jgi:hypothetical protein
MSIYALISHSEMKLFQDWELADNIVPKHVYDALKQKSRMNSRLKRSICALISKLFLGFSVHAIFKKKISEL